MNAMDFCFWLKGYLSVNLLPGISEMLDCVVLGDADTLERISPIKDVPFIDNKIISVSVTKHPSDVDELLQFWDFEIKSVLGIHSSKSSPFLTFEECIYSCKVEYEKIIEKISSELDDVLDSVSMYQLEDGNWDYKVRCCLGVLFHKSPPYFTVNEAYQAAVIECEYVTEQISKMLSEIRNNIDSDFELGFSAIHNG